MNVYYVSLIHYNRYVKFRICISPGSFNLFDSRKLYDSFNLLGFLTMGELAPDRQGGIAIPGGCLVLLIRQSFG